MKNQQMLSVVLPIFNEPEIGGSLKIIDDQLKQSFDNYEIICVNDGSVDNTLTQLKRYRSDHLKILSYPKNIGKGFALCSGFNLARGQLVAFMDADLELNPRQLALFTNLMALTKADIVIGSKRHPLSQVRYSLIRKILSFGYQVLIALLFGLNISDTQVGIKLFKYQVLKRIIPRLVVKSWAFDLEILVVAKLLGYKKIIEAPVEIKGRHFGSKIKAKAVLEMFIDTMAVFYRRYIIKYYQRKLTSKDYQKFNSRYLDSTKN